MALLTALAALSFQTNFARGESASGSASVIGQPARSDTVARIHWIGADQIARDTSASNLVAIGKLPETARLQAQTLDKLATAPWRLLRQAPDTNAAALLRPLLEDVLHRECYFEARQHAGEPAQIVFAIRLDDRRAALWRTNLAAVFESLTYIKPVAQRAPPVGPSRNITRPI